MKTGKRSNWKLVASSPIVVVVAFILLVFIFRAVWNVHKKAEMGQDRLTQIERDLADLKKREDDLSTKVNFLSTPEGIESEIRNRYRAVQDGESVAVIIDDTNRFTTSSVQLGAVDTSDISLFRRMLRLIGF